MKFWILSISILLVFSTVNGQIAEGYTLKRLTDQPYIDSNPQWSPDGKIISFDSNRSGTNQLFLLDPDSLVIEQSAIDSNQTENAVWDPTGNFLVATVCENEQCKLIKQILHSASNKPLLNRSLQTKTAHFHPAGKLIAFMGKSENDVCWRLYTYDFKYDNLNSFQQPVTDCFYPRWSPKGEFISYTTSESKISKNHCIQIIHWYGKDFQQIADTVLDLHDASWAPAGSKILYIGNNVDSSYLYMSQRDGKNREIIFKSKQPIKTPCWSPDGRRIIFTITLNEQQQNIYQLVIN
jgi:Tol biopolymer transport system component